MKTDISQLFRLLYDTQCALNSCMRVGNPAPFVEALNRRLTSPVPGDWVVEQTAGWMARRPEGVGRLIMVRDEPMEGSFDPDEPRPMDRFWYIENADGRLGRWWNCRFIALPTEMDTAFRLDPEEVAAAEQERREWVENAIVRHGLNERGGSHE